MKINIFDTRVITHSGQLMHFDVLLPLGSSRDEAVACAIQWLKSIGVKKHRMHLEKCNFCHSETAAPEIEQSIANQGYSILEMEGCPSPIN